MRKFNILFLFLFAFLFCAIPKTHAQFWKKIFKKGHKTEKAETPNSSKNSSTEGKTSIFSKKEIVPKFPESEIKGNYRIDVLIPLFLNTLVQNGKAIQKELPDNLKPNINFYEGLKMAADSLNNLGFKLDIYIHDITDPTSSSKALISNGQLKQSDLIIGYLQSDDLAPIAKFSKENHINFISALSPSDAGIENNPYFILLQPTLSTHVETIVDYALKRNKSNPKFLFYLENTSIQKEAYNQLEKSLGNEEYIAIDCSKSKFNKDSLITILDSTKTNVLFINILSTAIAEPILKELQKLTPKYSFEIYGMPTWKALKGINSKNDYESLDIYYTNPFFYEHNSGPGIAISQKYKNTYGGIPSELVFRGYESLFWLTDLLERYGTIFIPKIHDVRAAPFTRYAIKPVFSKSHDFLYFENRHLYIFHYRNGYFNIEK